MKILAVECADSAASCAVVEDGKIVCESFVSAGLTHSRTLMPMVGSMLKNSEQSFDDIDRFAVTVGPGSFTGLRIGVAAVKGMAYAADKPCVGISTLYAAALGAAGMDGIICAVMDARCNQVYNALFKSDGERLARLCDDRALMCDELESELAEKYRNQRIILVGGGAQLCYNRFKEKLRCDIAPIYNRVQRASLVGLAAQNAEPVSAGELLPAYLRLPQAERELKAKTSGKL